MCWKWKRVAAKVHFFTSYQISSRYQMSVIFWCRDHTHFRVIMLHIVIQLSFWSIRGGSSFSCRASLFFTRLPSWESANKIIARRRNISPLYPLHPSLALSLFLSFLRDKFKTKVQLKTILEVVLSELKLCDFHQYVQERVSFLQKHSLSLKLQYIFRAHVIFQFTHYQRRAVAFELGNVVEIWMVTAIHGRC